MNWVQISTAVITLAGGAFFYLLERLPGTNYFIPTHFNQLVIADSFGSINQALPSFIHPFAFNLLTVGILACKTRKSIIAACMFWLVMEGLFEALQHDAISQQLVPLLPAWFNHVIILDNIETHMKVGRFDSLDLLFIVLGVIVAFIVSTLTRKEGANYEKQI